MEITYISMPKHKEIKILFVFGPQPEAIKLAPMLFTVYLTSFYQKILLALEVIK
jgi:UDP-N-acetylglucosamine 2-epimerase